jgi:hypothetical protein
VQRVATAYGLDPEVDFEWQSVAPGEGLSSLGEPSAVCGTVRAVIFVPRSSTTQTACV